jgi:hypothetical protein
MAAKHGRAFQYLSVPTREEDLVRKMAEDEGIQRGLVCVFSVLEPCRAFTFRYEKGHSLSDLSELSPRLLSHGTLCLGAKAVMSILGRKLTGHFQGEIISDIKDCGWRRRIPGARIKHRVKANWLKMHDKAGSVLRVEMVIHNPEEFKVRMKVARNDVRLVQGKFFTQLFSVQADYNFSPDISWSNLIQYDNESRLLGFQSRFRWIIKPGSDLFLVLNRGWERTFEHDYISSYNRGTIKLQYNFRF